MFWGFCRGLGVLWAFRGALGVAFCGGLWGVLSLSGPARGEVLHYGSYGSPGLIDMPVAQAAPDGQFSLSMSFFENVWRGQMQFQITPRLSGGFRYSIIDGYLTPLGVGGGTVYDRSFDVSYLLSEETRHAPSLMIGLRDFGGTGLYESEYIVATKHLGDRLTVTGGLGWGRLGSFGGFTNPLGLIDTRFERRPVPLGIGVTGKVAFDRFFRGDAALFGGVAWQATDRLKLLAEYSSDGYVEEVWRMGFEHRTPLNFGVEYRRSDTTSFSGYLLHGAQLSVQMTYSFDPRRDRGRNGIESAPAPIVPRDQVAAASWGDVVTGSGAGSGTASGTPSRVGLPDGRARLAAALAEDGLALEGLEIGGTRARLALRNPRYGALPEALGRAARQMANTLPPEIETFEIVPVAGGMALSSVTLARSDLEDLEHALDGSWQSFARARIAAPGAPVPVAPGAYPDLHWRLTPYLSPALFDPDDPVRADLGVQLSGTLGLAPGLMLSGAVRAPVVGNRDQATRVSTSVLPHVRSDVVTYDTHSEIALSVLTADYLFRPGPDLYGRVSAGYFEPMFGGVSGELLWKPVDSRLGLGIELNRVAQRAYDQGFGFQDYAVTTGHVSAYYDFGGGYVGQLDAGRYLAGDWGATVTLDREFDNGFRVGGFFTLTDVPFSTFGEGAFDKGIRLSIPVEWLAGMPSRRGFSTVIRPIQRDGGARVEMPNRLYEMVRAAHAPELQDRWGRFWR